MTDTGKEAVERLAHLLDWPAGEAPWRSACELAAATLRALAAERDVAVADECRHSEAVNRAEAERDAARAALRDLLAMFRQPGENHTDAYERIAGAFYAETQVIAPGKSEPLGWCGPPDDERARIYSEWYERRLDAARRALAQEPQR